MHATGADEQARARDAELIPMCAWCKKVRTGQGRWRQVEEYLRERCQVEFTHGMCPGCMQSELAEARAAASTSVRRRRSHRPGRLRATAAAWVALLALAAPAVAHEGHVHKVAGIVVAIDQKRIEIKDKDGNKRSGLLGRATKYLRGKTAVKRTDVRAGERVVISFVTDEGRQTVREVQLGPPAEESSPPADKKQ